MLCRAHSSASFLVPEKMPAACVLSMVRTSYPAALGVMPHAFLDDVAGGTAKTVDFWGNGFELVPASAVAVGASLIGKLKANVWFSGPKMGRDGDFKPAADHRAGQHGNDREPAVFDQV